MTDIDAPATVVTTQSRHRRRWPWIIIAVLGAAFAVILFWFQPQKLFINDRVDEAIPSVSHSATAGTAPLSAGASGETEPSGTDVGGPVEVVRGDFVSLDHGTSGVARVLEFADGSRIVRLEGLNTDNGPDLFLYLTTARASGDEGAFDDEFVNLGRLKGNQGDQNYELAAGVDLGRYTTVVIWCDRFNSAFGAADLA